MAKISKTRVWIEIVYPESAPPDWIERLREKQIPFAVSPLHNPDETEKKPHWHLILKFAGPKTYDFVQQLREVTHGNLFQKCLDIRAYTRYLIHYDNPEKQQFGRDPSKIGRYNGYTFGNFFEMDSFDAEENLSDLFVYISENGITEYATLIDELIESGQQHFFNLATKKYTLAVRSYLTSFRNLALTGGADQQKSTGKDGN